jgi:hypothetical protein
MEGALKALQNFLQLAQNDPQLRHVTPDLNCAVVDYVGLNLIL